MNMKTFGMTAIALLCSVQICAAQTPAVPDEQRAIEQAVAQQLHLPKAAPGTAPAVASGGVAATGQAISSGWNYFHAYNCSWYVDSSGNQYFFVWPSEGGYFYSVNNLYVIPGLQISCVNGNWEGVYVTDTSTGAFDFTYSFPYQ
jgi:hypothetical protein